jgi:hypothetical protein
VSVDADVSDISDISDSSDVFGFLVLFAIISPFFVVICRGDY